ncbi:MAG TPA: hypothetical protein P5559_11305 [Candidatus Limiplasma sp.]|nr:hypothetical protein [Candidatus Limiplasma sp.]
MLFKFFMSATETVQAMITETPAATEPSSSLAAMSIFSKGLFTTLLGLVGVFLVLALFYVSIKIMQRKNNQPPQEKE